MDINDISLIGFIKIFEDIYGKFRNQSYYKSILFENDL